jgi:uncharacterized protein (DUF58 family)
MNGPAVRDRLFKAIILALLIFSILVQILVSAWFYDKLRTLESRLSLYPVNKPVEVDLKVTIPELLEIDRKIDLLNQRLGEGPKTQRASTPPRQSTKSGSSSKGVKKTGQSRKSTRVDVVEKIAK